MWLMEFVIEIILEHESITELTCVQVGLKLVKVLLLDMFKVLELSGLFVCLGGLVKILSAWGTEEIAGLWFAKGDQYPG